MGGIAYMMHGRHRRFQTPLRKGAWAQCDVVAIRVPHAGTDGTEPIKTMVPGENAPIRETTYVAEPPSSPGLGA